MPYEVRVLKMGQCQVRGPEVYWMDRWDDWEEIYFYMILMRGEGKVAVACAILFLDSDEASYVTGASLMVDGDIRHNEL